MSDRPTTDDRKHPNQPIGFGPDGLMRFKKNHLIERLLKDHHHLDLNQLFLLDEPYGHENYVQLMQLLGITIGHFIDIDCVPQETAFAANVIADRLKDAALPALPDPEYVPKKCRECGADHDDYDCIPF